MKHRNLGSIARTGILALLAVAGPALASGCPGPGRAERRWPVMGTYATVEIHATTEATAEAVAEEIHAAFDRVDATLSNWRDDSTLSRINREARAGAVRVEDPDVYRILKLAREYARLTGGAFDPTVGPLVRAWGFRPHAPRVPSDEEIADILGHVGWRKFELLPEHRSVRFLDAGVEIDLGGIAKGYALDVAARSFARSGVTGGLVDLGGNLCAWGRPVDGDAWTLGLRDPQGSDPVAEIDVRDRFVATSGNYENAFDSGGETYGHLLDPATGRPARTDVVAATAIADAGAEADAYATALFVGGSLRAESMLRDNPRLEAILLVRGPDGLEWIASASLKDRFRPVAGRLGADAVRVRFLLPPRTLQG